MAIGREGSERGGVIDPVDVRGAGSLEWASVAGVPVGHHLVTPGAPHNPENRWGRVVTTPAGQSGPAGHGLAATPEVGPSPHAHWSELLNLKGSAAPWLLLAIVAIVFMVHFSINAEGGAFGRHLRAGASVS